MRNTTLDELNLTREAQQILHSEIFGQACRQTHHLDTTVAMHSVGVARYAMKLCDLLERNGMKVDRDKVLIGSLCHDLGIIGRDEKFGSSVQCCLGHPVDSVTVAKDILGDIDEKTAGIIRTHMWPLAKEMPDSREALIVNVCDKHESVMETLELLGKKSRNAYDVVRHAMHGLNR